MALWRSSLSQRGSRETRKQLMQWIGESSNPGHPSSKDAAIHTFTGVGAMPGSCGSAGPRSRLWQEVADLSLLSITRASSAAPPASGLSAVLVSRTRNSLGSHRQLFSSSRSRAPTPGSLLFTRTTAATPFSSAAELATGAFSTQPCHFHRASASSLAACFSHARRGLALSAYGAPKAIPLTAFYRSASQAASSVRASAHAVAVDASVAAVAVSAGTQESSLYQQLRGNLRSYYELSKTRLRYRLLPSRSPSRDDHSSAVLCTVAAMDCQGSVRAYHLTSMREVDGIWSESLCWKQSLRRAHGGSCLSSLETCLNDASCFATFCSLLVVATAAAGFVMGSGEHVDWALCAKTCAGTFLAAASANSFNQVLPCYEISLSAFNNDLVNDRLAFAFLLWQQVSVAPPIIFSFSEMPVLAELRLSVVLLEALPQPSLHCVGC